MQLQGDYILAFAGHFVAGRHTDDGLFVNQTHRTHKWEPAGVSQGAMGRCLSRDASAGKVFIDPSSLDYVFEVVDVHGRGDASLPGCSGGSMPEDAKLHWLRITQNRAQALGKKRKHEELSFDDVWEMSMSPVCCPTYGAAHTSRIRLPLRCLHQVHLPHLAQAPSDFLREALPLTSCSLLEITNKHSRDKDIRFEPQTHTYYVKELRVSCSVTGLVHMFANEFDPDTCIARMQQGRRWPRPEYSHQSSGTLIPFTAAEIKAKWRANAAEASARGTWLHHQVEVLLNGGSVEGKPPELDLFAAFLKTCPKLMAFRTEWCIYSDDDDVAGCIDFVCLNKDGKAVLFDWKRTRDLCNKFQNSWSRMKMPLGHLDDCAGQHYSLQLNLYKHILQRYYQLEVQDMFVVGLHPDLGTSPFVYKAPDMFAEVQMMLASHRERLRKEAEDMRWEDMQGAADKPSSCTAKVLQQGNQNVAEYQGGKSAETCAADFLDMWEEIQFEVEDPDALAHPQPARSMLPNLEETSQDASADEPLMPCEPLVVEETRHDWELSWPTQALWEWESSDESEDGFWDPRPDWLERAERRLAAQRLSYTVGRLSQELVDTSYTLPTHPSCASEHYSGGSLSLPDEVIRALPQFYFSLNFLKALGLCSTTMLHRVRQAELWSNLDIDMEVPEYMYDVPVIRAAASLGRAARSIIFDQPQLACLLDMPPTAMVRWQAINLHFRSQRACGFTSSHPLLGTAKLQLKVSSAVRTIVLGVKSAVGNRTSTFCKIYEAFTGRMCFTFGMSGQFSADPRPFPAGLLFPDAPNDVMLVWHQRYFGVQVNGRRLCTARLREGVPDAPGPQAHAFVWTVNPRRMPGSPELEVSPLPSPVCRTGVLFCQVCGEDRPLHRPLWRVCPSCLTWVCAQHVGHTPWQQCPGCPLRFEDYIGGSNAGSSEIVVADDQKYARCVFELLSRHADLLARQPALKQIVPVPGERMSMSKRRWETCMYQARTILDFLQQEKYYHLFLFLHARARQISCLSDSPFLVSLAHPCGPDVDADEWRQEVADAVVELQSRFRNQARRSWEEVEGGAEETAGSRAISQTSLDERIQQELDESVALALADNTQASEGRVASSQLHSEPAPAVKPEAADQQELQDLQSLTKRRRLTPAAMKTSGAFDNLFEELSAATAGALPQIPPHQPAPRQRTVLQHTTHLLEFVKQRQPSWSDTLVRAAAAGLTVYRTRYQDLFVRDYVALLWIMEGERYLRSHNGTCYLYHEHGAFEAFRGIPPESTFARVKPFLLTLEGMFRTLSPSTGRSDDAVLNGIAQTLQQHNHEPEYFEACRDAALYPPERPGRAAATRSRQQEDEAPNPADGWPCVVANMISKIAGPLQKDLLDERRLLQFVVEWCETPSSRQAGVAFADACLLYDRSPDEICTFVDPSPSNNIYIRIPHALRDPVLRVAQERFELFVRQTFWCNEDFFGCCLAAQALAKRGENVDRCFIGESAGGTGQSLYSSHLAAVYKHNHAFIDPNLWHNEDELRKQIESFATSFIITAQEKPESNKTFREDLYKKMISADDLAGRKPYGYVTRMLRITGWKRIETNAVMTFKGVAESNFNSVLRRSLVWNPQSVFVDKEFLDKSYPDAAPDGIFPKDPCLREFLESGPAIAASLHQQLGFERRHSRDVCRKMIEAYAASGCTERKMRNACGLLPQTEKAAPAELKQAAASVAPPEGTEKSSPSSADDVLRGYLDKLGSFMLSDAGRQTKITSLWWKRFAPAA